MQSLLQQVEQLHHHRLGVQAGLSSPRLLPPSPFPPPPAPSRSGLSISASTDRTGPRCLRRRRRPSGPRGAPGARHGAQTRANAKNVFFFRFFSRTTRLGLGVWSCCLRNFCLKAGTWTPFFLILNVTNACRDLRIRATDLTSKRKGNGVSALLSYRRACTLFLEVWLLFLRSIWARFF